MPKKLPISAVMVIYNEEKLLERAIKSFIDLIDELIIVHDGKCSDRSLKIARKYTKKIYVKPHVGEAEPHRAFTYEIAKNEWILQVDADEYLTEGTRNSLQKLIKSRASIYEFSWPITYKDKLYYSSYKTALFRKSKVYFIGVPHEYVKPVDKNVKIKRVEDVLMNEPDYDLLSIATFRRKWVPWAKIQANYYHREFSKISKWNYSNSDWDYPTNIKLKHPLLYGIFFTVAYHLLEGIRNVLGYKSLYFIKQELYTSLYLSLVFYNYKFSNK